MYCSLEFQRINYTPDHNNMNTYVVTPSQSNMSTHEKNLLRATIKTLENDRAKATQSCKEAALALKVAEAHESALTHQICVIQHQIRQLELQEAYGTNQNAPLSIALAQHKDKYNKEPSEEDRRYLAGIPARITKGNAKVPFKRERPRRGDTVMITREYISKIEELNFQQLHVVGAVEHSDINTGRIKITVAPGKTIEKKWKNTVILCANPSYERAHADDLTGRA